MAPVRPVMYLVIPLGAPALRASRASIGTFGPSIVLKREILAPACIIYIRSESSNRLVPVALYSQIIVWS